LEWTEIVWGKQTEDDGIRHEQRCRCPFCLDCLLLDDTTSDYLHSSAGANHEGYGYRHR
jgi:hypothetical protein